MIDWNGRSIPWATVFKARQEPSGKLVPAEYRLNPQQRFVVRKTLQELHDPEMRKETSIHEAMHGHYSKIPYTYMPPRFITYADGRWDMAPASIHHIRDWAMTSDREIADYLKMCLAPTHAGRTGILGLGVEPWKYAPDLQRVIAFLKKVNGDEPGRGDLLANQAIVELQVELNDPAVQKMILDEAGRVYQKLFGKAGSID